MFKVFEYYDNLKLINKNKELIEANKELMQEYKEHKDNYKYKVFESFVINQNNLETFLQSVADNADTNEVKFFLVEAMHITTNKMKLTFAVHSNVEGYLKFARRRVNKYV